MGNLPASERCNKAIGSGRLGGGVHFPWELRETLSRSAFPAAKRSSTVGWGPATGCAILDPCDDRLRRWRAKVAAGLSRLLSASSEACVNERSREIGLLPIILLKTAGRPKGYTQAGRNCSPGFFAAYYNFRTSRNPWEKLRNRYLRY